MDVKLRWLRYFVAVAEELHFGEAAKRLYISGPALSAQIRQLEAEMDVALFVRTTRRVRLTPAGRLLLEGVRPALQAIDATLADVVGAQHGRSGTLTVGFVSSLADTVIPRAVERSQADHPDVTLRLVQSGSTDQLHDLDLGLLHLGILWSFGPGLDEEAFDTDVLGSSPLHVAVPLDHRLARARSARLEDFAQDPWIHVGGRGGASYRQQFEQWCHDAGFTARIGGEAASLQTMLRLVAGGHGISLSPSAQIHRTPQDVALVALEGEEARLVAVRQKGQAGSITRAFLAHLTAALEEVMGRAGGAPTTAR